MDKLIVITGPTATGKTALGVGVAKKIGGEIISTDSMQIYRGMDVGTAKVTKEETQNVPHYMIDVVDPKERFTVADYQKMALPIIENILKKGKTPILVGGTGLYINSLLYNMTFSQYDEEIREKVRWLEKELTNQELWDKLFDLDPVRAKQLSVNDTHRVSRAIEVALKGKSNSGQEELNDKRFDADVYVLSGDRQEIYQRINSRVDVMLEQGLIDEVKNLVEYGLNADSQAFGAIAYKELYSYLIGDMSLNSSIDLIKQRSRNYAKRQLTWARRYYPQAIWLDYKDKTNNLEIIVNNYKKWKK